MKKELNALVDKINKGGIQMVITFVVILAFGAVLSTFFGKIGFMAIGLVFLFIGVYGFIRIKKKNLKRRGH